MIQLETIVSIDEVNKLKLYHSNHVISLAIQYNNVEMAFDR
jgi:hypothetical protein